MAICADFLIIGAGIAGAGLAYRLAPYGKVILLEREEQAGYHTTGRSAAFYAETYGGEAVRPLTTASKAFFISPPEGFTETPLQTDLGAIHIFNEGQRAQAERMFRNMKTVLPNVLLLSAQEVLDRVPYLSADKITGGVYDPDCTTLDVAALHQGFLKGARRNGADVRLGAGFLQARFHDGVWQVETRGQQFEAPVLINAAGAWADDVAVKAGVSPLGMRPLRRTIVTVPSPEGWPAYHKSPIVMDVDEQFYFKPEGKGFLLSPADETPSPPTDAQPYMEDVALAVHHFEQATSVQVKAISSKWAGLRTFAPDRVPVIGFSEENPGFFWSVGQGGYGIQTAPAWSALAACLILKQPIPEEIQKLGVDSRLYSPNRLKVTST